MPGPRTPKRDFTIPEEDLQLIRDIQSRCRKLDLSLNDSEVVRVGVAALMGLPDKQFLQRISALIRLKRGPTKKA
jgi:hypothetical protein